MTSGESGESGERAGRAGPAMQHRLAGSRRRLSCSAAAAPLGAAASREMETGVRPHHARARWHGAALVPLTLRVPIPTPAGVWLQVGRGPRLLHCLRNSSLQLRAAGCARSEVCTRVLARKILSRRPVLGALGCNYTPFGTKQPSMACEYLGVEGGWLSQIAE